MIKMPLRAGTDAPTHRCVHLPTHAYTQKLIVEEDKMFWKSGTKTQMKNYTAEFLVEDLGGTWDFEKVKMCMLVYGLLI